MTDKLVRRGTSLVDLIVVARSLPREELDQITAFGGTTDPEAIAVSLFGVTPMCWTFAERESGEPLAVGGYIQTGPTVYRSFFLANQRLWDEHGAEMTKIAAEMIEEITDAFDAVRLETYCLSTRRREVPEWYEKIGLRYDATLRGFGVNGEDALLYSAVKKPGKIQLATVADMPQTR